jgi:chromosome segregation ATPase
MDFGDKALKRLKEENAKAAKIFVDKSRKIEQKYKDMLQHLNNFKCFVEEEKLKIMCRDYSLHEQAKSIVCLKNNGPLVFSALLEEKLRNEELVSQKVRKLESQCKKYQIELREERMSKNFAAVNDNLHGLMKSYKLLENKLRVSLQNNEKALNKIQNVKFPDYNECHQKLEEEICKNKNLYEENKLMKQQLEQRIEKASTNKTCIGKKASAEHANSASCIEKLNAKIADLKHKLSGKTQELKEMTEKLNKSKINYIVLEKKINVKNDKELQKTQETITKLQRELNVCRDENDKKCKENTILKNKIKKESINQSQMENLKSVLHKQSSINTLLVQKIMKIQAKSSACGDLDMSFIHQPKRTV